LPASCRSRIQQQAQGDMIIARLANIGREEMEARLDVLGAYLLYAATGRDAA